MQTANFSTGHYIACRISTRSKKRVQSRSNTQVVLDTSKPTGGVEIFDLKIGYTQQLRALEKVLIY